MVRVVVLSKLDQIPVHMLWSTQIGFKETIAAFRLALTATFQRSIDWRRSSEQRSAVCVYFHGIKHITDVSDIGIRLRFMFIESKFCAGLAQLSQKQLLFQGSNQLWRNT